LKIFKGKIHSAAGLSGDDPYTGEIRVEVIRVATSVRVEMALTLNLMGEAVNLPVAEKSRHLKVKSHLRLFLTTTHQIRIVCGLSKHKKDITSTSTSATQTLKE
jgi:hypothetical protein